MRELLPLLSLGLALLASCKSNTIEYTNLAALASQSSTSAASFDVYLQDTYVTAVSDSEILIEDKTGAARISVTSETGLKQWQLFSAHLAGKSILKGGGLELSDVQISGISASDCAMSSLPYTETSISSLADSSSYYVNRRLLLKDITFAENFNGHIGDKARVVQGGRIAAVIARNAEYYAVAGNQGDIYVYPSEDGLRVYTDKEFSEHEVVSPFTKKSGYGIYKVNGSVVQDIFCYTSGVDQLAYGSNSDGKFARIQSYTAERVMNVILPSSRIRQGNFINVSLTAVGFEGVSDVSNQEMYVEKFEEKGSRKMWLMDFNTGYGYIIQVE